MKIEEIACSAQVRELGKICLCVMNVVANSIDRVFRCFVAARCFPFRIPLHTLFIVVFFFRVSSSSSRMSLLLCRYRSRASLVTISRVCIYIYGAHVLMCTAYMHYVRARTLARTHSTVHMCVCTSCNVQQHSVPNNRVYCIVLSIYSLVAFWLSFSVCRIYIRAPVWV